MSVRCAIGSAAVAALVLPWVPLHAQPVTPTFAGVWVHDAARSDGTPAAERLEITQSLDQVHIRMLLCCQQHGEIWTTTYYFNNWGPRSATPAHIPQNTVRRDTKPTQARWDEDRLVLHAGPDLDTRGGSVRILRLTPEGRDLVEEIVHRGLGREFDFREASIPRMYARDRHVYTRSAASH